MSRKFVLGVNLVGIFGRERFRCLEAKVTSIECFESNSFYELIPVYMIPVHLLVILLIRVDCNLYAIILLFAQKVPLFSILMSSFMLAKSMFTCNLYFYKMQ